MTSLSATAHPIKVAAVKRSFLPVVPRMTNPPKRKHPFRDIAVARYQQHLDEDVPHVRPRRPWALLAVAAVGVLYLLW
jgi:hypothetical protein